MSFPIFTVFCMTVALSASAWSAVDTPIVPIEKKIPMLELLPKGSELKRVSIPRYEKNKISHLLTAEKMRIKGDDEIAGFTVNIYLYNKKGDKTHLFTNEATYYLSSKKAVSSQKTILKEKNITAEGTGLHLDTISKKGFLQGPIQTTIRPAKINK